MRARTLQIGVLFCLLAASPARAVELDPLLARLETSNSSLKTLAGEFTQTSHLKLFRQDLVSRGRFTYRRPSQLRWEYLSPDPSTLEVDGDRVSISSPGAPTRTFDLAHDATMRVIVDQLLLWLGSGSLARARGGYELAAGGTDAAPTLALTPRPDTPVAKAFSRIELRFDDHLQVRSILLRERSGDEKEIVFTKVTRNGPPH
jgi:outer membrane lipoprotein-sorting protein